MKWFNYSALLLSAYLIFVSCKKEESLVPNESVSNEKNISPSSKVKTDSDIIPGKYIVVYKSDDASIANINSIHSYDAKAEALKEHSIKFLAKHGISGKSIGATYVSSLNGFVVNLSEEEADKLSKDPTVVSVEQDRIVKLELPTISGISADATQISPWGIRKVGSSSGAGKTAWIIDTGIDFTHPDLIVDATRSKSFLGTGTTAQDQNGHGTHVSGIIAAKDDGAGVIGVAYGATVVSLRALDANGSGTYSGVIAAVDWASGHAAAGDVVNMSLGGPRSSTLDQAVYNASQKGIYFSIAAGNSSANAIKYSPARVNGTYISTVSAMDSTNRFAYFSNWGSPVDYAGPGVYVYSTYLNHSYATLSGTSMAAPHIAGLMLLKGKNLSIIGYVIGDKDSSPDPIPHL